MGVGAAVGAALDRSVVPGAVGLRPHHRGPGSRCRPGPARRRTAASLPPRRKRPGRPPQLRKVAFVFGTWYSYRCICLLFAGIRVPGGSRCQPTLLPIVIVRRILALLDNPTTFSDSRSDGFVFPAHPSRRPPPGASAVDMEASSNAVAGRATSGAGRLTSIRAGFTITRISRCSIKKIKKLI